eukprot:m.85039 g.85039  ORF g.85039 m.85039 type:complete len:145 (-) comp8727_c0_seq1:1644-2078(-)
MFKPVSLPPVVAAVALLAVMTVCASTSASANDALGRHPTGFTKEELAKYDGRDPELPILLSIKKNVFDVSGGAKFYGKGGSYNMLAGKEVTRAVALWSLNEEDFTDDVSDLSKEQLENFEETYNSVYKAKYPIVGHFISSHDEL